MQDCRLQDCRTAGPVIINTFCDRVCCLLVVQAQDETEKPLLKCYECAGVNNVCGSSSDLGTVTTCPAVSETCIVATSKSSWRAGLVETTILLYYCTTILLYYYTDCLAR